MIQSPKIVLYNAHITTLYDKIESAQAVCLAHGRIEAIGSDEEMFALVENTEYTKINCEGKYLYPGFIDTHSHLTMYSAFVHYVFCGSHNKTIAGVLDKLKERAKTTPKGEWILGYSFDDTGLEDQRHLDRYDLDKVSTEHPIMIFHISAHFGYVNSKAIELLGITNETKCEGGEYVCDENGVPTGFLVEFAFFHSQDILPRPNLAQMRENFKIAIEHYNACGFTTFFDGGIGIGGTGAECIRTFTDLDRSNEMNARAYLQCMPDQMSKLHEYGLWGFGSDFVCLGGLKYFTDGSIQGFTAALLEDYHTRPGFKSEILFPQEEIDSIIDFYHSQNIHIAVHTNGDAASESVITAFEKAFEKNPNPNLRHMLIHAQNVSDEHLARMQKIGMIPSFFARHLEVWGDRHASIFLGPERTARLNPAGSAVRLNMPFSLHVDSPVLPVTALGGIHTAVNRQTSSGVTYGEDQKISPLEALKAYTSYAALCCETEQSRTLRGRIAPNYYADFVLLEEDLLAVDSSTIKDIKVLKTICDGRVVYDATNKN